MARIRTVLGHCQDGEACGDYQADKVVDQSVATKRQDSSIATRMRSTCDSAGDHEIRLNPKAARLETEDESMLGRKPSTRASPGKKIALRGLGDSTIEPRSFRIEESKLTPGLRQSKSGVKAADSVKRGGFRSRKVVLDSDGSEDELPGLEDLLGTHFAKTKDVLADTHITSSLSVQLQSLQISSTSESFVQKDKLPMLEQLTTDTSSETESPDAFLHHTPPRLLKRPPRWLSSERSRTPPREQSSNPRLPATPKHVREIPKMNLRESLTEFWNPETVNEWNDQYSPQKVLRSPAKRTTLRTNGAMSPPYSPTKQCSPTKRPKAEVAAKKDFDVRKLEVAEEFLTELDNTITQGQIAKLTAHTGGVRVVWSNTLNTTAGRAHWRRETVKTTQADRTQEPEKRHRAWIELAAKVIDDEHRLLNTLAHEFCHLCNFMISGIKDKPHGAQFQIWGRKCTLAFGDLGVKVTTKHSYKIDYKYIWECSNEYCCALFKRHSKSIDPKRHTCGRCRSKLVQIQPAPRKTDVASKGNIYTAFVKEHFARVKAQMPGATQKEVMAAIGERYRADKARATDSPADIESQAKSSSGEDKDEAAVFEEVVDALETISVDGD